MDRDSINGRRDESLRDVRRLSSFAPLLPLALVSVLIFGAGACRRGGEPSLSRATEAWDSGDYEQAAEEYEEHLRHYPAGEKSLEARLQLANIYYLNLRRYDQAIPHYKEFLNQDSSSQNAHVARERLAELLSEIGRSYEAIAEFENLNPHGAKERRRIRLKIADLYYEQKNYSQALAEYARVTDGAEYDELSEQAYQREASIHHLSRGQFQKALDTYRKLASLSGDPEVRLRATLGIADCYAGLYQFDEAIKVLREVTDEGEQRYIARRIDELEQQKREAAHAKSEVEKKK
ncbi:MAG TPA: tetratricopeptide repeat protein [Blastocatellia bacterium]|nr:tetratricopeptide repeat protein [Blastocatellia bacterium]